MEEEELRKKIKKYDRILEIVFNDLNDAIKNPGMKPLRVGRRYVREYRDALQFLKQCYPQHRWQQFDLPHKSPEDFSADELWDWKVNIAYVRGYFDCYSEHVLR